MNSEPYMRMSSRSEENTVRVSPDMDFTLYGSPAPRYSHRSTPVKLRPLQPPNTPNGSVKVRKPPRLPIEKILLLNERIELARKEKIRVESGSRQMDLLSERREGGQSCSEPSSSPVDLSIDLSTVTNSDHDSDTASDEPDEFFPPPMLPKKKEYCESSTGTEGPSRCACQLKKDDVPMGSGRSSATEYPCSAASKRSEPPPTDRSLSPKCFRSRSADLIHLYVSTVNHKDKLTKYFRPCHVCTQPCCICPDLVPESSRSFPLFSSDNATKSRADKMIATDPEITEFVNPTGPTRDTGSESSDSEFSNFLVERYLNKTGDEYEIRRKDPDLVFDSGNSTLQMDEANDSEGSVKRKKPVSLSVMQLATAAQCARILANSLESVLETVDVDTGECKDFVRFKGDDLNELFDSLQSLKIHLNESDKWADFGGKEGCSRRETSLDDAFCGPINTGKTTDFTFEDNFDGALLSLDRLSSGPVTWEERKHQQ